MLIENNDKYTRIWNDTKKLITIFIITSRMKYLHSNNIHRDLKPDNILMDDFLCPKIADFGLSIKIHFDQKYYQMGAKSGESECMYKYAKMLFFDEGKEKNINNAMEYIKLSKDKGFVKSD